MNISNIVVTRKEGGLEEFGGVTQYTVHEKFLVMVWPGNKQRWINVEDILEISVEPQEDTIEA